MSTQENIPQQDPGMQEKEPSSFRLIFTLGFGGLISGLALVGAFLFTLPMIEANKAEALRKAIYKVLPGCAYFEALEMKDGKLFKAEDEGGEKKSGQEKKNKKIFAGFNNDKKLIGFAIPGEEPGFQDMIVTIFGYDAQKKIIIGFEVLESKETPGLGDKIFKDDDFKANFTALSVDPEIIPVGKGKKSNPNEVETITGATISSKAVVRLLNKNLLAWKAAIDTYNSSNDMNKQNNP